VHRDFPLEFVTVTDAFFDAAGRDIQTAVGTPYVWQWRNSREFSLFAMMSALPANEFT
jgi:hypothetical protein